jgi:hypothetical protein
VISRARHLRFAAIVALTLFAFSTGVGPALATGPTSELTAELDGKPIKLVDVGNWYCHDFSYPVIQCFSDATVLEADAESIQATTAVDYVTVYEYTGFAGSYMHMSQDYTALIWIGWSDRISSLKGRNSQTSHFYVDWYYGGAIYAVCCNAQLTSLGSWDNVFSSVHRN